MLVLEFRSEVGWCAGWSLVGGRVGVPVGGWLVVVLDFQLEVG